MDSKKYGLKDKYFWKIPTNWTNKKEIELEIEMGLFFPIEGLVVV